MDWIKIDRPAPDLSAAATWLPGSDIDLALVEATLNYYVADWHRIGSVWWRNDEYLVQITSAEAAGCAPHGTQILWLRIYRHDGAVIANHWQTLQQIKNELIGPEATAVEFYPPESELKDGENSYHLWVLPAGSLRFGLPGPRHVDSRNIPTRFVCEGPASA